MTTIAIVGSRASAQPERIRAYVNALPADTVIVSGGAVGADTVAADAARARGLQVIEYVVTPAEWRRLGKAAGMMRNVKIVNAADELVAFWDGVSSGTLDSIRKARKRGIRVTVVDTDGAVTITDAVPQGSYSDAIDGS